MISERSIVFDATYAQRLGDGSRYLELQQSRRLIVDQAATSLNGSINYSLEELPSFFHWKTNFNAIKQSLSRIIENWVAYAAEDLVRDVHCRTCYILTDPLNKLSDEEWIKLDAIARGTRPNITSKAFFRVSHPKRRYKFKPD